MAKIEVDLAAVAKASLLLESFLSEKISEGNFREGSHLHDVVIRAFSYVYALIDAEARELRYRQSFLKLADLTDSSAEEAVDDLASNWFLTRKAGTAATGTLVVRVSSSMEANTSITVPEDAEFVYSDGFTFLLDSSVDMLFNREDMTEVLDSSGEVSEYTFLIPIVADFTGIAGNLAAGRFEAFSAFGDGNVLYVETLSAFADALEDESISDFIERAKIAITARGTVSARAIETVLRDEVTTVQEVVIVGAGDAEMYRDMVTDTASGFSVHVLGHVNCYNYLPIAPVAIYSDGAITLASGDTSVTLLAATAGNFPITRIIKIVVTDTVAETSAEFTRTTFYAYTDSNSETKYKKLLGSADTYVESADTTLGATEYSISYDDPLLTGTASQDVTLNFSASNNARTVRVEYRGVTGLSGSDAILQERQRRTVSANLLSYGLYPAIATINIKYYLSQDSLGAFPVEDATSGVVTFVNTFPKDRAIRVSDIVQYFMSSFSSYVDGIGFPTEILYRLEAPDGSQVLCKTEDKMSVIDSSLLVESDAYLSSVRVQHQVSDRTTRVVTFEDLVTFEEI